MYSMPLRMTARLISQNARKQIAVPCATCAQPGAKRGDQSVDGFAADPGLNAEPTAGDQRTQDRGNICSQHSKRGARQHWKRDSITRARMRVQQHRNEHDLLPRKTVATACFQFIPPWIRLAASM